jgi:lipid-binding SYLF domain-containing protein
MTQRPKHDWFQIAIILPGLILGGLTPVLFSQQAFGQAVEEQTVQAAGTVLNEAMSSSLNRIPAAMLADCYGVAIVPNVIKGGFIVGARHGKGILFVRGSDGVWHAPVFITLTGGNIGWQIGVQSSDIVLVFKTERSVQGILSGKLTIGGDAAAAAGPVGRETAVATDARLKAEIYTYSRSRGLFAGVSIDGSVVRVDQLSTGSYYRSPAPGQPVVIPPSALALTQTISSYAGPVAAAGQVPLEGQTVAAPLTQQPADQAFSNQSALAPQPALAQQYGASESDILRNQLLELSPGLFKLLDPQWKTFLALPLTPQANGQPDPKLVSQALKNYDTIATDPQFASLAARPEFRSVHGLLKHYEHALKPNSSALELPPPPPAIPAF